MGARWLRRPAPPAAAAAAAESAGAVEGGRGAREVGGGREGGRRRPPVPGRQAAPPAPAAQCQARSWSGGVSAFSVSSLMNNPDVFFYMGTYLVQTTTSVKIYVNHGKKCRLNSSKKSHM